MRLLVFTPADQTAFARAAELMGGHEKDKLLGRLGENLKGGPGQVLDQASLGEAGRRELSWFSGGGKRAVGQIGPGIFDRQGASALRSLQPVLFYPGLRSLDLAQRAGLHRLARALCDLDQSDIERQLAHLPESWKESLRAAQRQLAEQPKALEAAANLRVELQIHEPEAES